MQFSEWYLDISKNWLSKVFLSLNRRFFFLPLFLSLSSSLSLYQRDKVLHQNSSVSCLLKSIGEKPKTVKWLLSWSVNLYNRLDAAIIIFHSVLHSLSLPFSLSLSLSERLLILLISSSKRLIHFLSLLSHTFSLILSFLSFSLSLSLSSFHLPFISFDEQIRRTHFQSHTLLPVQSSQYNHQFTITHSLLILSLNRDIAYSLRFLFLSLSPIN